jgi:type II secretory pathway component PulC
MVECSDGMHSLELRAVPADAGETGPSAGPRLFSLPAREFLALLEDRQRLAAQLSLEPAVAGGYVYGYRIAALDTAGDLAGLGIAEGDVITHVNGAPASEPDSFVQTIDALGGQPAFSIGIERGGARFSLDYVLDASSRLP